MIDEQKQASENISKIFNPEGTPEGKRKIQQKKLIEEIFE